MLHVPIFYVTTAGHTRRIADRLANRLRLRGIDSVPVDMRDTSAHRYEWGQVDGAVVVAPIRLGRYPRAARAFVAAHRAALSAVPSLFVSVSLSAASVNGEEREGALATAKKFIVDTDWHPASVASVAGAISYTRYSRVVRWWMRRVAAHEGGPTDTRRDHVLTDWTAVDTLADDLASQVHARAAAAGLLRRHA
jgi:menaquinone-dependent protoporphyrinogen oxidase